MVPVLKGPFQANTISNYLKKKLEPFYSEGKGRIVCPVCIVFASGDKYRIVYYTRTEFKAHYEKRHQPPGTTPGQIYVLASAYNCKDLVDQRNANPFMDGKCTHHEVHYSGHLRDLLLKSGTILPMLTLKVPAAARGEPEVVELDGDEERTKPGTPGSSWRLESRPLPRPGVTQPSFQGAAPPGEQEAGPLSGLRAASPSSRRAALPSSLPAALPGGQQAAPPSGPSAALPSG
jgi:hypothetical protein